MRRIALAVVALLIPLAAQAQVVALIDCWTESNGTITVTFGYISKNAAAVTLPIGASNFLSPSPVDRGQPITFQPGVYHRVFTATFVTADEASIAWTLDGSVADLNRAVDPECSGCYCPPGPPGPEGPIGITGPVGLAGATGAAGPTGATGAVGPDGPAGAEGATGPDGATGAPGPAGADGLTGATGLAGPQGMPGSVGPEGPAGPLGATGVQGPTGATGVAGAEGPQGIIGAQGPAGSRGPRGDAGPIGVQGPAGPAGPAGEAGPQGAAGLAGPAGPRGASGIAGEMGAAGPEGERGASGLDAALTFLATSGSNRTITVDREAEVIVTGSVVARGSGTLTLRIGGTRIRLAAPRESWSTIPVIGSVILGPGTHAIEVSGEGVTIEQVSISAMAIAAEPGRRRSVRP